MAFTLKELIDDPSKLDSLFDGIKMTGDDLNDYHPDIKRQTERRDAFIIIYGGIIDNQAYLTKN